MFVREYRFDLVDSRSGRVMVSYGGSDDGRVADRRATRMSLDLSGGTNIDRVVVRAVTVATKVVANVKEDN